MSTGLAIYTIVHVIISLVGIGAGLVVMAGLLKNQRLDSWTAVFLISTVLTSVTGFGFPFQKLLPSHIVGIISLVVLAIAIYSRYGGRLAGAWRLAYVVGATIALYLNVFVLVVQAFLKVPALNLLAPRQSEPPFAAAQGLVLIVFVVVGIVAAFKFKPEPIAAR